LPGHRSITIVKDFSGNTAMTKLLRIALTLLVLVTALTGPALAAIPGLHRRQPPPDPQAGPKQHQSLIHHHKDPYAPRKPPHPHKMPKPPLPKHGLHKK
jgi:hypothetical protein